MTQNGPDVGRQPQNEDPGSGALPDRVVDLLVVGGGPAGTAAAFRGKELGLDVFVVDFDDLMKRIRDYSKDKLILPSFGGGDQLRFPAGGESIEALRFGPIDKDEMCVSYKSLYDQHAVPYATGIELLGVDGEARSPSNDDGLWARLYDHRARRETTLGARAVALALGRGVPRRFDIPGNTDGVAFRLENPADYVGQPACVVGGGTSAAEAVIAISNAKAHAQDKSAVYWSYRGDRMPRVSQALAEVFFSAYIGNGNIRYYPRSEPAAIVTGDDHQEYLSIRVDRRCLVDRPNETAHLEFPKHCCVACIGEDLPEALLQAIGVERVAGGPKGRTRVVASSILESRRRNVFVLGDLLSQAYFQTSDFAADPSSFEEVRHRGNIKTALRDGVLVAEAVRQRLDGIAEPRVTVADAPLGDDELAAPLPVATEETVESRREATGEPGRSRQSAGDTSVTLYLVTGSGEPEELLTGAGGASIRIGRSAEADLRFETDGLLADEHAVLEVDASGKASLRDTDSTTGTFLRLEPGTRMALEEGDLLQVGRQFLQLVGGTALTHFDARGQVVGHYALDEKWKVLGRDAPDVILDAGDRSLSRRHLAVALVEGQAMVKDLRSANGSYLRLRRSAHLEHGARFRIGKQNLAIACGDQILDLDVRRPAIPDTSGVFPAAREHAAAPAKAASNAPMSGPSVTFHPDGQTFEIGPNESICDVAERNGVRLNAECHAGICGSDPIRIVSGHENLVALGDQESETLEDVCELEPGPCRLACMARVTGPVTVEIV